MKRVLLFVLAGVFLSVGSASAVLIDNDWYSTDTETQLDWLDLNLTFGLSIDSILSNSSSTYNTNNNDVGWIADGWRYATQSEIYGFYQNFSPATYNSYSSSNYDAAINFFDFWGITPDNTWLGGLYIRDNTIANLAFVEIHGEASFYTWSGVLSNSYQNSRIGSWLVRDTPSPVPEPTTMLLFGTGLIGLSVARKKYKK